MPQVNINITNVPVAHEVGWMKLDDGTRNVQLTFSTPLGLFVFLLPLEQAAILTQQLAENLIQARTGIILPGSLGASVPTTPS